MEEHDSQTDDFIGWKSYDGKLEVIGIEGKQGTHKLYKITCAECSKDLELFPEGYFVSRKGNLLNYHKPCGCSNSPKWKDWQYLILARRIGEKKGFIVHGFAEDFKGAKTKLDLECLKDGCKWAPSINDITVSGRGCPKCGIKASKDKQKDLGNGYGYYPDRTTEKDYLYILNFNNKFIKVGRSFDVKRRIAELKYKSKIKNIKEIYVLTGTHQDIYDLEQELHNELRERGFSYAVDWSTECFDNNSLDFIKYFIQRSGFKTVG